MYKRIHSTDIVLQPKISELATTLVTCVTIHLRWFSIFGDRMLSSQLYSRIYVWNFCDFVYRLCHFSFMELSPSWEAANCVAIQELPSILWNPKVHYCAHKSPPLVPVLNQINLIHTTPCYLSKIYFKIVHLPTSGLCHYYISHFTGWFLGIKITKWIHMNCFPSTCGLEF
jgi:hypothetical protein